MEGAKPCVTPVSATDKLSSSSGELLSNPIEYRSLVGALQYLTWTRPDITYAVNLVCQYMQHPTTTHLIASKRILRYIKGTLDFGLKFTRGSSFLLGFSDADWAGSIDDRRSTRGYCVFLGSNIISWSSKKQTTVARSSTEAEYRTLAHSAAEMVWICYLLNDLHFPISESLFKGNLWMVYVHTLDQIADIFTKGLHSPRFLFLRDKLMVVQIPISFRGDNNIVIKVTDVTAQDMEAVQDKGNCSAG
ncbi:uncharacterized protein LOC113329655 [Papaver somniferum]|uniref:uncharacterized protein LOC113329655 n=1 Tax=Papaver somniferum TaxID=3469 RepID=UPI000E6FF757|nr:uncharacterized protein LOC113329655 [Papaver somniferum]